MAYQKELAIAKAAAVRAGEAIMKIYERAAGKPEEMQLEYKADASPLTAADRAANDMIVRMLREAFPDYGILSEEEADDKTRLEKPLVFIVDPLDGTKEFVKRNGQFTVNIALAENGEAVMGVIYVPVTGELYWAAVGEGAWRNENVCAAKAKPIHVSQRTQALRAVLSSSHGCAEMEELLERHHITDCLRIGSSLKGCMVARGDAEIYYRFTPTMEWDTAAMQCIAEQAGALFRQMDDTKMRYNRENCRNDKGFYIINCLENRIR